MTKLAKEELDERLNEVVRDIREGGTIYPRDDIKQLIRDCIEAVTPEKHTAPALNDSLKRDERQRQYGYNLAVINLEANTKELLDA